jgi:hypothetical protein
MSVRDEPHCKIASTELAAWLGQLGTDRWWTVDGDPLLFIVAAPPAYRLSRRQGGPPSR